jgi:hypothetical protein
MSEMARAMTKKATYSVIHMVVAIGVAYALMGSWIVALGIRLVEPVVQNVALIAPVVGLLPSSLLAETSDTGA